MGEVFLLIYISYIFHRMVLKNWKHSFNKYSRITQHWARLQVRTKGPAHRRKVTGRERGGEAVGAALGTAGEGAACS